MARNEEKAMTLWNKWHTFKADFHSVKSNRRPLLASDCESLPEAEKWRREIVQNLTKKLSAIKNASLGEQRLRELNEEINKLARQKHYWEIRIRELGGTISLGKQFVDIDGQALPGAPGYKYYGAAKDLPGVRELFAQYDEETQRHKIQKQKRRLRSEIFTNITPEYYGFQDADDTVLEALEQTREVEWIAEDIDAKKLSNFQQRQLEAEDEEEYGLLLALAAQSVASGNGGGSDLIQEQQASEDLQARRLKELEMAEREKQAQLALKKSKQELLSKLQFAF
jgi:pre-mRNA-splicing factor ISY1